MSTASIGRPRGKRSSVSAGQTSSNTSSTASTGRSRGRSHEKRSNVNAEASRRQSRSVSQSRDRSSNTSRSLNPSGELEIYRFFMISSPSEKYRIEQEGSEPENRFEKETARRRPESHERTCPGKSVSSIFRFRELIVSTEAVLRLTRRRYRRENRNQMECGTRLSPRELWLWVNQSVLLSAYFCRCTLMAHTWRTQDLQESAFSLNQVTSWTDLSASEDTSKTTTLPSLLQWGRLCRMLWTVESTRIRMLWSELTAWMWLKHLRKYVQLREFRVRDPMRHWCLRYEDVKAEVIALSKQFPNVEFQHVYSHEGDPGNEIVSCQSVTWDEFRFAGRSTGETSNLEQLPRIQWQQKRQKHVEKSKPGEKPSEIQVQRSEHDPQQKPFDTWKKLEAGIE